MKCAMCGYEFEARRAASGCAGCPLSKGCVLVRCPNCGYEMPGRTRLGGLWRKIKEWRGGVKRQG